MESPRVSDWVIWVVMECSRHDQSIFPGIFGSGTVSHSCYRGEGPFLLPNYTGDFKMKVQTEYNFRQ